MCFFPSHQQFIFLSFLFTAGLLEQFLFPLQLVFSSNGICLSPLYYVVKLDAYSKRLTLINC